MNTTTSSPPARLRGALAALLTGLLLLPAATAEVLRPPNMEKEIFDPEKIELKKFTRSGLVSNLVSVARDFNKEDHEVDMKLRAHALAIAGRLDPESPKFQNTLEQLLDNGKTVAEDADRSRVVGRISSGVEKLLKEGNEDNKKCAAYCIDIALRLDPKSKDAEDLEKLREELEGDDISADWAGMLKDPVDPRNGGDDDIFGFGNRREFKEREVPMPGGKSDSFARKQAEIFGLVVITLGNGKHAGAASSITATARIDEDSDKLNFKLNQKVGPMMSNSLESIVAFLEVNYLGQDPPVAPKGYWLDIKFEDPDTLTDGPSAGTAMALLLESLFTGEEIDPGFACTGGITPAGKCTKIGGVAAKIRGATNRSCKIVGVPEGNAGGVADILVLNGIDQLLEIQIFSMKDMKEARAISRKEKDPAVQSTLDDFAAVASVVKSEGEKMLQNSAVQAKLEAVLEKMPNHLSAKLLLQAARNKAPSRLTVGGSFHEIDSNASGVFSAVQWGKLGSSVNETASEAVAELEKLDGKVDERLDDYLEEATELCKLVKEGRGDDDEDDYLRDVRKKFAKVRTEREKLMNDPELQEELRG